LPFNYYPIFAGKGKIPFQKHFLTLAQSEAAGTCPFSIHQLIKKIPAN